MAFRIKSEAERAALAARTPREKAIDEAKERFLRTVKGFATDMEARRRASTEIVVLTVGDSPQVSFGGQVKDHDGRVRATSSITIPYREDGGRVTHANIDEMRVARYWSSRTDREEHSDSHGLDPRIDLSRIRPGAKVTLIGSHKTVPGRDGRPDDVMFIATKAREGVHEWNEMMGVDRDTLADFVDRYVSMKPESYRDGVAQLYAETYVDREEAKAASREQGVQTERPGPGGTGSKGPSNEPALHVQGRGHEGR